MAAVFLFAWLFAIPIFALEIAKTGNRHKDFITPIFISRQDCQPGHKPLFSNIPVHDLCLKFGWIAKKSTPEPEDVGRF
jgi:hypothetical protein